MAERDGAAGRGHPGEWFIPALLWVVSMITLSNPEVRDAMVRAFGERPLGAPVIAVVAVVQTVLMLPLLWALVHGQRIARQALADGGGIGPLSLLWQQRALGARHPHLRRSQQVCAFGLLYFVILLGAWIAYTHHRGI